MSYLYMPHALEADTASRARCTMNRIKPENAAQP